MSSNSRQVWDIHVELADMTQDPQDHKAAFEARQVMLVDTGCPFQGTSPP